MICRFVWAVDVVWVLRGCICGCYEGVWMLCECADVMWVWFMRVCVVWVLFECVDFVRVRGCCEGCGCLVVWISVQICCVCVDVVCFSCCDIVWKSEWADYAAVQA